MNYLMRKKYTTRITDSNRNKVCSHIMDVAEI